MMLKKLISIRPLKINFFKKQALRYASFGPIELPDNISQRLERKRITQPTEIQNKAMQQILEGQNIIINSETGSGKTLCYLIPIILRLQMTQKSFQDKLISSSHALIFAPTTELLHQIGAVCNELGIRDVNIAHDRNPLQIKDTTQFIISTPKFLMNYQWQAIKNIKCIVFDEADLMFVSQLKEIRKMIEFYSHRKVNFSKKESIRRKIKEAKLAKKGYHVQRSEEIPQFIFAGATIPQGGRKTALSLLEKLVPNVKLIQTDMVHRVVESTKFDFIEIEDDFDIKVSILAAVLERERFSSLTDLKQQGETTKPFRAILYTNTVADAQKLFEMLNKRDERHSKSSKYMTKTPIENANSTMFKDEVLATDISEKKEQDHEHVISLSSFRAKWKNSFCFLHSGLKSSERLDVIDGFTKGKFNVLVTTSIAGRGLDIPNVDLVVQFDFPLNVADILHRAGRTARAGAKGKVISFVCQKNQDLYQLFCATLENKEDVTHLFSRRRRLRRKIKAGLIEPRLIREGTILDK